MQDGIAEDLFDSRIADFDVIRQLVQRTAILDALEERKRTRRRHGVKAWASLQTGVV